MTDRPCSTLAGEAAAQMGTNAEVVRLIGKPITIEAGLKGIRVVAWLGAEDKHF